MPASHRDRCASPVRMLHRLLPLLLVLALGTPRLFAIVATPNVDVTLAGPTTTPYNTRTDFVASVTNHDTTEAAGVYLSIVAADRATNQESNINALGAGSATFINGGALITLFPIAPGATVRVTYSCRFAPVGGSSVLTTAVAASLYVGAQSNVFSSDRFTTEVSGSVMSIPSKHTFVEPGSGSVTRNIRVVLDPAPDRAVVIPYLLKKAGGIAPDDFSARTSGKLRFAAGQAEVTIPITLGADLIAEDDASFVLKFPDPPAKIVLPSIEDRTFYLRHSDLLDVQAFSDALPGQVAGGGQFLNASVLPDDSTTGYTIRLLNHSSRSHTFRVTGYRFVSTGGQYIKSLGAQLYDGPRKITTRFQEDHVDVVVPGRGSHDLRATIKCYTKAGDDVAQTVSVTATDIETGEARTGGLYVKAARQYPPSDFVFGANPPADTSQVGVLTGAFVTTLDTAGFYITKLGSGFVPRPSLDFYQVPRVERDFLFRIVRTRVAYYNNPGDAVPAMYSDLAVSYVGGIGRFVLTVTSGGYLNPPVQTVQGYVQ